MPLTILSDADVRETLDTLTRQDILNLHHKLADALHSYSTATNSQDSGCCSSNQPSRISIKNKDGDSILFMPAMSDIGMGVKIITIAESNAGSSSNDSSQTSVQDFSPQTSTSRQNSIASKTSTGRSSSPSTARSSSPSTGASQLSTNTSHSSKNSGHRTDPRGSGIIVPGTPITHVPTHSSTSPSGSITLLTPSGTPRALINASTLTAFRTALVSTLLIKARASVHTCTVFGAGLQAFWHVYISILLRGEDIHHLHIVNRDFTRAQKMIMRLVQSENEAVSAVMLGSKLRPSILTPDYVEYARLLKENVRAADVIFCCTPSTEPLFPAVHLTSTEGRRKGRYIAAIGSYKPHMQEIHEDVLRQAVRGPHVETHKGGLHVHQRHASEGGAIIVDTIEGASREAGEIIRAGIGGHGMVEIGEIVMLRRGHRASREEQKLAHQILPSADTGEKHHHGLGKMLHLHGHQKDDSDSRPKDSGESNRARAKSRDRKEDWERTRSREREGDGGMMDWLERGNVIYKSVGLGLMDVVVGMEIVRLAEERGIGTLVSDF